MSREDMLYQIYYSHCLEKMFSVITGRTDRILSFLLLLLGSSVAGGFDYPVIIGLLVTIISALQVVFQFGRSSGNARKQAAQYLRLYNSQALITNDNDLLSRLLEIQDNDCAPWSCLVNPAQRRTSLTCGEPTNIRLSGWEKCVAFLAGY